MQVAAGDVWHLEVDCPRSGILYGVRVYGEGGWDIGHRWDPARVLLDPYAPLVSSRRVFGVRDDVEQYEAEVFHIFSCASCVGTFLVKHHADFRYRVSPMKQMVRAGRQCIPGNF